MPTPIVNEYPDSVLRDGIIKAAIAVHRRPGPGFLESIDEETLCIELHKAKGTQTGLLLNFFSMPLMIKRVGPDRFSDPKWLSMSS